MPRSGVREILLRFVRTNGGLKLLSLCLAVAAWYAIRDATSFETVIKDIPINVRMDAGWAVLDASASDVDVMFRGSATDIRFLNRDQVSVDVDLRGKQVLGATTVSLVSRNVRSPGGARPFRVDPPQVTFSIDQEGDRSIPIKAEIVGELPDGVEVERIECSPATVTLHGPARRLQDVDLLLTEPIDLEGRIRSFALNKSVRLPTDTWTARVEPDRVEVRVTLAERSTRRTLEDVRVSALRGMRGGTSIRVSPDRVKVVLEGRSDEVTSLDASTVLAFVDCTQLEPGQKMELPVRVQAPSAVRIVEVQPAMILTDLEEFRGEP